ncbi:dihydrolipoamide acetyltransferase family protein [Paraflavisolibacter sp. H34]|uniref:dihydrolipoamide acetyltransferase family protein n=1 Tax=Huijunlia imazamoxiresistens TaxID=3127457 RepID=UPI003018BC90
MAIVDLVMPKMGESIAEATILKWHKKPGDKVKTDETVLEVATDKVDSEVPSTEDGILEEVMFQENDVVPVGAVIARIKTGNASVTAEAPATPAPTRETHPQQAQAETAPAIPYLPQPTTVPATASAARFYSPLVLNIAASEGISMYELENIPGTGNEGRVTKKDILQYVAYKKTGRPALREAEPKEQPARPREQEPAPREEPPVTVQQPLVIPIDKIEQVPVQAPVTYGNNVEVIEMDRMRKLISEHMVRSKQVSPHVTSFSEADVTNLVRWRDRVKKDFEKREGTKITFTPLFIEAILRCIKKFPLINSSVDGERILVKKDINIGMATALANGNLIVPVIKNADQLNLVGLTRQVNTLADNARNGRLRPEDTQGGTFTFTNVGTFGSLMGTPIINQPQVAILAVGSIKKRPVVIETPQGDSIAIRHMMYLSMSYDHRIIDGSLGATFLTAVANELENFNPNREY